MEGNPARDAHEAPLDRSSKEHPDALDELFERVYGELRERAHAQRRRWRGDETLNTTALIHETYLKLARAGEPDWDSRAHFFAVASRAMRQVLMDYARAKGSAKRGGGREHTTLAELALDGASVPPPESEEAFVRLDEALTRLERDNPRHARIVECRFFGSMTIPETAEALGLSPASVKRGWTIARAWLYRDLSRPLAG